MSKILEEVKEATFISFMDVGEKHYVNVKVRNKFGGKDNVNFLMQVDQHKMRHNEWEQILIDLQEKNYEKDGGNV